MVKKYGRDIITDVYPHAAEKRAYTQLETRRLYKAILQELNPHHFTWSEVEDEFNAHTPVASTYDLRQIRYTREQHEELISIGLIEAIPDSRPQAYRVVKVDEDYAYPTEDEVV